MNSKYLKISKYVDYLTRMITGRVNKIYSQCGEDIMLDYYFHHKENGFYIDIGANHPKVFSNTYFFYKKGWNGIVVEPNKSVLDKYISSRPRDTRLNVAVSQNMGSLTFYKFKEDVLNTTSKEVAESYEKMGHKIISTETVACQSLSEIFKNSKVDKVDFLSIDTEGQNYEVLTTNDWDKFRPMYVVVETAEFDKPDNEQLEEKYNIYMSNHGYKKIANTPLNTIYKDLR